MKPEERMERRYKRIVMLLVLCILLPTGLLATLSVFAQSQETELMLTEMEQNHYALARAMVERFDVELLSAEEKIIRTANLFCPDEMRQDTIEEFFALLKRRHRLLTQAVLISEEKEIVWPPEPFPGRKMERVGKQPFIEPTDPEEIERQKRAVEAKLLLNRLRREGASEEEVERQTRRIIEEIQDEDVVALARLMLADVLSKKDVEEATALLRPLFKSSAVLDGKPVALFAMLAYLRICDGSDKGEIAYQAYKTLIENASLFKGYEEFQKFWHRLRPYIRENDPRFATLEAQRKRLLREREIRQVVLQRIVPRITEYLYGVYRTPLRKRHIQIKTEKGQEVYSFFTLRRRLLHKQVRMRFVIIYRLNPEEVRSILISVLSRMGPVDEPRLRVLLFGKEVFPTDVRPEQFSVRYVPPNMIVPLQIDVYSSHVMALKSWLAGRTAFNLLLVGCLVVLAGIGILLVLRSVRVEIELARLRAEFVSSVSHELKTPLTSIMMFAEMLHQGRIRSADKAREYSRIIVAESQRLFRMITNVLDFARLEEGRKEFDKKRIDIRDVVEHSLAVLSYHIDTTGFVVEKRIPNEPLRIIADPDAMEQVTVNLLSNAIKYSQQEKWIGVRLEKRDSFVILEVEDHGIGIPKEEKEKIFERFYRTSVSRSSKQPGTGIGLNLVKTIVEAHGGKVEVESELGKGSVFRVILPAMEEEEDGADSNSGR